MKWHGLPPLLPVLGLAVGAWLALAEPASAMKCSQWTRLTYDQKFDTLSRMIEDAVAGQGGRQMSLNRNAVGRCMHSRSQDIFYDFEDTCADSRAGMQALNNAFKNYLWDCVR